MDIPDSYKNFEKIVSYNESEQQMDNLDVTDTHYDKKYQIYRDDWMLNMIE